MVRGRTLETEDSRRHSEADETVDASDYTDRSMPQTNPDPNTNPNPTPTLTLTLTLTLTFNPNTDSLRGSRVLVEESTIAPLNAHSFTRLALTLTLTPTLTLSPHAHHLTADLTGCHPSHLLRATPHTHTGDP
eukprot:scaffold36759_cov39-Phaeocystis_antarctica.AAC.2